MSNTIFKLKPTVTNEDLKQVGFIMAAEEGYFIDAALKKIHGTDREIYIPLEECESGDHVIQYNATGTKPEDLDPEDIEDLITKGWVDEIEVEEDHETEDY